MLDNEKVLFSGSTHFSVVEKTDSDGTKRTIIRYSGETDMDNNTVQNLISAFKQVIEKIETKQQAC